MIQYNRVMRTYFIPEKLNKFNPNIPDTVCVLNAKNIRENYFIVSGDVR